MNTLLEEKEVLDLYNMYLDSLDTHEYPNYNGFADFLKKEQDRIIDSYDMHQSHLYSEIEREN